jgi:predicted nuclease of predicted toxin-antitoxin system
LPMRILLDECVPRRLKRELPSHDVFTVRDKGWAGKKNGDLLKAMHADSFDVLLTVDKGLQHQQNLTATGVAVVFMTVKRNTLSELLPLMPAVETALIGIKRGDVVVIAPPSPPVP